jgi:hypothetical protein
MWFPPNKVQLGHFQAQNQSQIQIQTRWIR